MGARCEPWTLAFLVVVCGWLSAAALVAQAPERVFTHTNHVGEVWAQPGVAEVWRDCRGCHRFDAQREVSAPQAECDACHAGNGKLERKFAAGWENDLARQQTRSAQAFRHSTHGVLACRQCHAPAVRGFVPDNFTIRTGPGFCAECHEQGRADPAAFDWFGFDQNGQPVAKPEPVAYAKLLVAKFGGETGGMNNPKLPAGTEFDHADHLEGFTCVDCHDRVRTADAGGVGVAAPPTDACQKCHQADAQRTALQPAPSGGQTERPLWSLGTFAHGDHYRPAGGVRKVGVASDAAYEQFAGADSCRTCHVYKPPKPGTAGRDFPFAAGSSKHRYVDCRGCHDSTRWSTAETVAAPLHDSTRQGGGWTQCASCHVFGTADFATARPEVDVQRQRERTFVFPTNVHPDITTNGIAKAAAEGRAALADCAKCHRARVPELATRLEQRVFRHATHLSAQPKPEDCQGCHPTAGTAATSRELASDAFRTYDLGACTKCHWGGAVTELSTAAVGAAEPAPAASRRVEFSHRAHVGTAKVACTECHALAADGRDVATLPEAIACSKCHDHEAGGPKAEGLFGEPVHSCVLCHGQGEPRHLDVPAPRGSVAAANDRHYQQQQTQFAGFRAGQYHPATGNCTECHLANRLENELQRIDPIRHEVQDQLFAAHAGSVHGNGPRDPAECMRCHWLPSGNWVTAVRGSRGTEADKQLRIAPGSPQTRAKWGNERVGYPGTDRANG